MAVSLMGILKRNAIFRAREKCRNKISESSDIPRFRKASSRLLAALAKGVVMPVGG